MKPSKVTDNLSGLAWLLAAVCAFMILGSGAVYFIMDEWFVMTSASWFVWAIVMAVIAVVLGFISKTQKKAEADEARRQADQAQAERTAQQEAARHADHQASLAQTLQDANNSARASLDSLPGHLEAANDHLRQAEVDWKERVFNPFWTSVEGCACSLANFKSQVANIQVQSERYASAKAQYEAKAGPFAVSSISVTAMQSYKTTADHMAQFTRRAQGDIDFANIFEMWRGNAIMESGFASLRSAINTMGRDISSQISSLGSSIGSLSRSIDSNTREVTGAIAHQTSLATMQHNEAQASIKQSLNHEKVVADRLRNIEHGYKPVFG